jgi:hypothetical protein
MQALRFHRRLSTLFAAEAPQPFTALASSAGTFDLFEVGERHELWDTLWGLEFLSLWPQPSAPARASAGTVPRRDGRHDEARTSAPVRAASFGRAPTALDRRVHDSGRAVEARSPRTIAEAAPARDRRPAPPAVVWRTITRTVRVPQWPAIAAPARQRQRERRQAELTTIARPVAADASAPRVRAHAPIDLELQPRMHGRRDGPTFDQVAIDRRPVNASPAAATSVPAATSLGRAVGEPGVRGVAPQPERPDAAWRLLVTQSQGQALGIVQRVLLEPFFPGLNLADIRVHTDEPADRAARSLRADAFTLGRDIFFRAHRFETSTARGLALVSHELSHTRQILGGEPVQSTLPRRDLEREAVSMEATVLRAFTMGPAHREEPGIAPMAVSRGYVPLSLEGAHAMPAASKESASVAGIQRSTAPAAVSPVASAHGQPLKAEAGRPAAGGAAAGAAGDDPETATRTLLRMLDRKLRIDKERRGVDRWVR